MAAPEAGADPDPGPIVGLSAAEAARRLAADGPNTLPGGQRRPLWRIAADTLREPMFALLLAAGALYLAFGDLQEGLTLFGMVLATLALTLVQDGRTERAVQALRDLSSPRARVLRDGQPLLVAGADVVRGDLLQLAEGDRVPADALLVRADGLQADESLLTGEAVPVAKCAAAPGEQAGPAPAPGGDDQPFVWAGTLVVQGQALAVVQATGARSAIGRIGADLGRLPTEATPLQRQTARLVKRLALLAAGLSLALVLVHGLLRGDWLQALLAGIALAMAILPEEYPVVLTLFPALGARRLARQGVLTRRITAIETLGATTVLCSDKTGTLTENRMAVRALVAGGCALDSPLLLDGAAPGVLPEAFHTLVEYSILASVQDPFDPMEKAFHTLGASGLAGTEHLHRDWQLVRAYGLSPALRAMSHVWRAEVGGTQVVAAKGAPEAVVDLCHLDAAAAAHIAAEVDALAAQGLRVLAVAQGRFDGQDWPAGEHDFDFTFVGLLGLHDPLRPQVPAAVAECRAAGIRVLMITGDYPATARVIAAQAGLAGADMPAEAVLTGDEIDRLDDAALRRRLHGVVVCARIAPAQKLRIVQALQADGGVVAMTGDGVNDAPALRAAHVGVVMGGRGTDVAREAAVLVLVKDDFAAIVAAVRLGRRIFDNLRQAMAYLLAVHVPIAGMALLPVLAGWPPLLLPTHIALLELIIDPACTLAFEAEPAVPGLMQRPPRDTTAPLFSARAMGLAVLQGAGALGLVLGAYAWGQAQLPEAQARGVAFAALVLCNLALILGNRSASHGLWHTLRTPNATLWAVIGTAVALLAAALFWPWAAQLLRLAPLTPTLLGAALVLAMGTLGWCALLRPLQAGRPAAM